DASLLEPPSEGGFDLAYARLVLMHTQDPAMLIRRMFGWLRPGGCLMVQDYDVTGGNLDSAGEAGREFQRVANGVFQATGRDSCAGQNLPYYFQAAGLGVPDGTDVSGTISPMTAVAPMLASVYRSLLPQALRLGLTTEAKSEILLADLAQLSAREDAWGRLPLLISAWKRK